MVKAKKSLGQNFLKDEGILEQIMQAAELSKEDTVLEVGPGKGALTNRLIEAAGQVIAVELDDRLIAPLIAEFSHHRNFKLVHEDALKFTPPTEPYKIVANIPYYITSPLLNHYLKEQFLDGNPPEIIVFMVQKEVAEKILAKDGKHSVLSLQVHLFGQPELICHVPPEAFEPRPKIHSSVIKIRVADMPKIPGDLKKLFWLIHMCFAQKRKKLSNNLSNAFQINTEQAKAHLKAAGIDPDIRAEKLNLEEWNILFSELRSILHSS